MSNVCQCQLNLIGEYIPSTTDCTCSYNLSCSPNLACTNACTHTNCGRQWLQPGYLSYLWIRDFSLFNQINWDQCNTGFLPIWFQNAVCHALVYKWSDAPCLLAPPMPSLTPIPIGDIPASLNIGATLGAVYIGATIAAVYVHFSRVPTWRSLRALASTE